MRPQPTVLLKTTTPTTKLLTSFSRFLMAQNFTEFQRRTSKRCSHKSPSRQEFLINIRFPPVKGYQPMFDRKRGSLCYPTTPKHLSEPCAPTPHLPLFHTALGSPFPHRGTYQAPCSPHSAWDTCAILFLCQTHCRDAIPQAATRNTFLSCGGEPLQSSSGHCQSHQVPAPWRYPSYGRDKTGRCPL